MKKFFNLFVVALAIGALFIGCKKDSDDSIDVPTTTHYAQPADVNISCEQNEINISEGTWEIKMGFESVTSVSGTGDGEFSTNLGITVSGNSIEKYTVDNSENITLKSGSMYEKIVYEGFGFFAQGMPETVETDPETGFKTKYGVSGADLVIYAWGKYPQKYINEINAANPTVSDMFAEIESNAQIYKNSAGNVYYITFTGTKDVDDETESEDPSSASVSMDVEYTVIIQKK